MYVLCFICLLKRHLSILIMDRKSSFFRNLENDEGAKSTKTYKFDFTECMDNNHKKY